MKNKVVVLGSVGMAGHIMVEYLRATGAYDVVGIARQASKWADKVLDVTDFSALETFLEAERPKYVINCVGALVAHAQKHTASAILLNSYLPHFLSEIGARLNFKLVHISTDCVFSGKKGQYVESSFRDGDDYYARSKSLGEVINNKDLTIRTSIIGPELKLNGTGLLDWFLKQGSEVSGYTKAFWSGVTTLELAKATEAMMSQNITGLFHLCPTGKISKFELLKLFAEVWEKAVLVKPFDAYSADKSLLCTRHDFAYSVPEYEGMLKEMKSWMVKHKSNYTYYNEVR